ncbi:4-(cytidine 5'-diphospho)-2-C-methyl-D-erythritol kinase [Ornithinibacillus halophilus]|uniref:4-diphosphocytidyl-2-C-methyl-D-erythritol kinase n=1 Tax=Ornithinibacillus halophilus TaxID=930117 RepID=A0A1M5JKN6_9BACI|nr:4-(cytidine 5'-diphospho)-2-C-methyl-D-erythritol kinase [Ornithinibacillus halophilus]SHG40975.1 4-diphosphocytidyl-2-C-methyl-D-erythritol kinase [Ornithinibacillus halophilus]
MTHFEKAPAKINLSLDVLSKRTDGEYNVEMIMTSIDLADRIELTTLEEDRIIVSLWSRYVPNDERNLAYKAASILKEKYNLNKGIHIKIDKCIPVSAGLGGGSTDAAAVLRGLNKIWDLNISMEELAVIGAEIDSDVPYCIYSSTAIAKGRGEIIEPLPSPPSSWVVLAKPNIGVSTKAIFKQVDLDSLSHPNTEEVIDALHEQDFEKLCSNIGNSLEDITTSLHPEVNRIKEKMTLSGAEGVLMSGSGPTVYGLVKQESKAQRIYNSMKGFCSDVHIVRILG